MSPERQHSRLPRFPTLNGLYCAGDSLLQHRLRQQYLYRALVALNDLDAENLEPGVVVESNVICDYCDAHGLIPLHDPVISVPPAQLLCDCSNAPIHNQYSRNIRKEVTDRTVFLGCSSYVPIASGISNPHSSADPQHLKLTNAPAVLVPPIPEAAGATLSRYRH